MRRLLLAAALVPLLAGCSGARTVTTAATTTKAGVPKNERHFLKIPLRVVKGGNHTTLAVVPVYIGTKGPYDFALDTGASVSVVDLAVVHELGLKRVAKVGGFTGVKSTTSATIVRVPHWRAAGVQLPAASIASVSLADSLGNAGLKGLLGSDVLSRYDVVTIDYRGGELRLEPKPDG
jgi:hypothetical protein